MNAATNDTLVLKPSRVKQSILLAGSLAFVVVCLWALDKGSSLLWLPIVFFGLCALVFAIQLLPGSSSLTLTPEKFIVRTLFRSFEHTWDEVESFFATHISVNKMVAFNYSELYTRQQRGRAFSSKLTGVEAALPDSFGMKPEDLAMLLNSWKAGDRITGV